MSRLHLLILLALVGALTLGGAACGGSSSNETAAASSSATVDEAEGEEDEEEAEAASPDEAAAEIDTIVRMLDSAVADVRAGRRDAAAETVGDAYLEHFEHVEHPLGERDHDLMEDLEERISTDLRTKISDGVPAAEIARLVDETQADLAHARELLAS